jgi:HK97 family phage major capsid protein
MTDRAVKILSKDDKTAVVGGWGVVFGGKDLYGEDFSPNTDFDLDYVPNKHVYYDHALSEVKNDIGKVVKNTVEDMGVWVEAQIERSKAYAEEVLKLIEQGIIGWSSGTAEHLVVTEGKSIKRWPIIEFSLTPTPAEPRTLGVERLKILAKDNPKLKALLPQESGEDSESAVTVEPEHKLTKKTMEESKMTDVTLSMEEYKDMLKAQVRAPEQKPEPPKESQDPQVKALNERLDALTQLIENSPKMKDAGYVAPDSEDDHEGTKSLGDFLVAVKRGNTKRIKSVYKTALAEEDGATGGYLVPTQFVQPILAAAEPYSVLRRAGATVIPMSGNTAEIPALDIETAPSAGDTAFAAGVVAVWESEAGEIDESEPRWRMVKLMANKLAAYSLASNELIADSPQSVESILTTMFGRAIGSKENYGFLRGDGVQKPLGVLNSGAVISGTRSAASTVALADLSQMMSDFLPSSWGKGVWLANPTVADQLIQLVSSPLSWMENVRDAGVPMKLLGMPLYFTGALPSLGTTGDILLIDPSYYLIGDRQGIEIAYSEHYKFVNDQGTWRVTARLDGQPWIDNYVTLEDASTTVSPFVTLTTSTT